MDATQAGIWRNLIKTFGNNPLNTRMVDSVQGLLGGTPIVGDVQSGLLAANDLKNGNYSDAAWNGIGLLPFVPSMAGTIKKQTVQIPASDKLFEALSVAKKKVMADVDKLQRKHPEHFASADDVENHLKYVFGDAPDHIMDAKDPRYKIIARDSSGMPVETGEQYRSATADFTGNRQGNYWVRSAYPMPQEQVNIKVGNSGVGLPPITAAMIEPAATTTTSIAKTPFEINHEIARQNAVKMLGLPEANTAMDRAKALGFEASEYHGTKHDFNYFDLSKNGTSTDSGDFGAAIYTSSDPSIANNYAIDSMRGKTQEGANVIPLLTRSDNQLKVNGMKNMDNIFKKAGGVEPWLEMNPQNQAELVKELGFDSVRDYGYEQTAHYDPSKIRSIFAAFDPARIKEPDLLAGLGGASLAGLLGMSLFDEKRKWQ